MWLLQKMILIIAGEKFSRISELYKPKPFSWKICHWLTHTENHPTLGQVQKKALDTIGIKYTMECYVDVIDPYDNAFSRNIDITFLTELDEHMALIHFGEIK